MSLCVGGTRRILKVYRVDLVKDGHGQSDVARRPVVREPLASHPALGATYRVLQPGTADAPPQLPPAEPRGPSLPDQIGARLQQAFDETKERWRGRVPEIGALTATTMVLAFLAFSAGASGILTLLATTVAIVTIWAPWRRI